MGTEAKRVGCADCLEGAGLDFEITMAFQPIVRVSTRSTYAYEALVRGRNRESAGHVLAQVNEQNRYRFDQACRVKAIELASRLGLPARDGQILHINFLPGAVYRPETCIRATLEAAERFGLPVERIVFEVTEGERVEDEAHLKGIFSEYQRRGFRTAIDDFGAGYAGLNLLANLQPDIIKLDMALTRNIDQDRVRRSIAASVVSLCRDLGIAVVAEGIETVGELDTVVELGVDLVQGYLLAKPAFEAMDEPVWPPRYAA